MGNAVAESNDPADMEAQVADRVARLSAGQLDCLRLVDQHLSSKEIAAELHISPHTVDQRIRGSLQILGVER
ncbi:MAG: sigma factor-like helix-turn-helix DNA-binding protein, partial [Sphingomicrobium sp.]